MSRRNLKHVVQHGLVVKYDAPTTLSSCTSIMDALEKVPEGMIHQQLASSSSSAAAAALPPPILPPPILPPPILPPPEAAATAAASRPANGISSLQCAICLNSVDTAPSIKITNCGHAFHKLCIGDALHRDPKCPMCRQPLTKSNPTTTTPRGKCPSGVLTISTSPKACPGFFVPAKNKKFSFKKKKPEPVSLLQLYYHIPSSNQLDFHPNPGEPFDGTTRYAYLPNNWVGRELLCRLVYAWKEGLVFHVGHSLTSQRDNQVVWSSIPHKTSLDGGLYGFPDPQYISACHQALDTLLVIPDSDACRRAWNKSPQFFQDAALVTTETIQYAPNSTSKKRPPAATAATASKNNVGIEELPMPSVAVPMWAASPSAASAPLAVAVADPAAAAAPPPPATMDNNTTTTAAAAAAAASPDCAICLESLDAYPCVRIKHCGHVFHELCIQDCLNCNETKCPNCRKPIGIRTPGRAPSGSMSIQHNQDQHCPGFPPHVKTISILYNIPSGIQKSYHYHPDQDYRGTRRVAYLPDHEPGRRLLSRLMYAFHYGHSFLVGTSLTSGEENVVTWSSIHHKTSLNGGPHGFPDDNYIFNCNAQLDSLHIPKDDECWDVIMEFLSN